MNAIKLNFAAFTAVVALICGLDARPASAQTVNGGLNELIPSLYGGDGITLRVDPVSNHSGHFSGQSLDRLSALSESLAGRAAPSFNLSPSSLYEFDPISEEFVRLDQTSSTLLSIENAQLIGAGKFGLGAAFTHQKFSTLNGVDLDNLTVELEHVDGANPGVDICLGGAPGDCHNVELDIVRLDLDVEFKESALLLGAIYGVTDALELSVLAPLLRTRLQVASLASIVPHESAALVDSSAHEFGSGPGEDAPDDMASGSATGIGDVTLRAKYALFAAQLPENVWLALSADLRLPTGAEADFQGVPHVGFSPKLTASTLWSFAGADMETHASMGYVLNGTGDGKDALRYAVGQVIRPDTDFFGMDISFSTGILGWKRMADVEFDAASSIETIDHEHDEHMHAGEESNTIFVSDTSQQIDLTLGVSARITERGFLFYETRLPLDDTGLRANVTHSFGFQATF